MLLLIISSFFVQFNLATATSRGHADSVFIFNSVGNGKPIPIDCTIPGPSSWSPDGQMLAILCGFRAGNIKIFNSLGKLVWEIPKVFELPIQPPKWSHNGSRLYVIDSRDEFVNFFYKTMTMADIASKKTIALDYSKFDGTNPFIYFERDSRNPVLKLKDLKVIDQTAFATSYSYPLISRDGQQELSFVKDMGLYVTPTGKGKSRVVGSGRGLHTEVTRKHFASWSPNSKRIVYAGDGLYTVDPSTANTTDLIGPEPGVTLLSPSWIKNNKILFVKSVQKGTPAMAYRSYSIMLLTLGNPNHISEILKDGQHGISIQSINPSPVSGLFAILGFKGNAQKEAQR